MAEFAFRPAPRYRPAMNALPSSLLGAVLAGGESRRFGSDKAAALLDGQPLIDHAVAALAPHVGVVVICGRGALPDRPRAGLGPLGGIAAALHHAADHGFEAVLTIACDTPRLPPAILAALLDHPIAYAAEAPTVARWPAALADALDAHLAGGGDRSIRRWAAAVGAVAVAPGVIVPNINTPADLLAFDMGQSS